MDFNHGDRLSSMAGGTTFRRGVPSPQLRRRAVAGLGAGAVTSVGCVSDITAKRKHHKKRKRKRKRQRLMMLGADPLVH